jgi:hypothetical protein
MMLTEMFVDGEIGGVGQKFLSQQEPLMCKNNKTRVVK